VVDGDRIENSEVRRARENGEKEGRRKEVIGGRVERGGRVGWVGIIRRKRGERRMG
jgi:hypothetical protein